MYSNNTSTNMNIYYTISSTSSSTNSNTYYRYKKPTYGNYYYDIDYNCKLPIVLKENFMDNTHLQDIAEERIEDFIYENIDKNLIIELATSINAWITEKAYDICDKVINDALLGKLEDEYSTTLDSDSLIETLFNGIDFNRIYEIIDEICNQPMTTEEQLNEVGMSIHDFL